jgi:hypothetical protein
VSVVWTPTSARRARLFLFGVSCLLLGMGAFLLVAGVFNSRFLDEVNRDIARADAAPEERVLRTLERLSHWQYFDADRIGSPIQHWLARAEHASPLHVSARTSLTAGVDRVGPCGGVSRSMIVLLRRSGLPVRKALLYSDDGKPQHTVVEVLLDGEWRVFDPTYGWYWRRLRDGEIATAEDLRDPELLAAILAKVPDYPLDRYSYRNIYHLRWEKIPGLPAVRELLRRWRGDAWVRSVGTPQLYERPAFLVSTLASGAGLVSLLAGAVVGRRARRVDPRSTTRQSASIPPSGGHSSKDT